jgi:hypothetical protein
MMLMRFPIVFKIWCGIRVPSLATSRDLLQAFPMIAMSALIVGSTVVIRLACESFVSGVERLGPGQVTASAFTRVGFLQPVLTGPMMAAA